MSRSDLAGQVGRESVVRRALFTFWQKGAESASYNNLVEATGLSRKALYALWPDKAALVHEAMALYRKEVLDPLIEKLGPGGRVGLEDFWNAIAEGVRTPGWSGCFLFRSAGGELRSDTVIAEHFDDHARLLRTQVSRAVAKGVADQSLDHEVDPDASGWQALAVAALISNYGALGGDSETVTKLIGAGRMATGLLAMTPIPAQEKPSARPRTRSLIR